MKKPDYDIVKVKEIICSKCKEDDLKNVKDEALQMDLLIDTIMLNIWRMGGDVNRSVLCLPTDAKHAAGWTGTIKIKDSRNEETK